MLRRGLAAAALLALASAGAAEGQAPIPPPVVATTLLVSGHGWGHGVGMAQWGANGYAQHGWAVGRILAHYYPGTRLGPAPVASVRVLLAEGRVKVALASTTPWRVVDGEGVTRDLAPGTATVDSTLGVALEGAAPVQLAAPLTFSPRGAPLRLGPRPYRGTLQVRVGADGKLQVIDVVGLEGYVKGVVPAEMPYDWEAQALQAQAVAARSYALANRTSGRAYDLYADVRSQVYLGLTAETPQTNAAVDVTRRRVLLYRGQVANAMFHSTSGGRTVSFAEAFPGSKPVPYLVSVTDPYDDASPYHDWGPVLIDGSKAAKALGLQGGLTDLEAKAGPSGRVATALAHGTRGDATVTGAKVRFALGLRSTWFRVGLLSLSRPFGPVPYGSGVTVTGAVRDAAGLVLEQRTGAGLWQLLASVATDARGRFSTVLRPSVTTELRLSAAAIRSVPLKVPVAPVVRLEQSPDGMALVGTARPALAGAPVEVQRQDGIVWTTAATAVLDAAGAFSVPLPLAPGTYRARYAPGGGLVAGTSALIQVAT